MKAGRFFDPADVEIVPIGRVRSFDGNARIHDMDTIRESLRYHGQYKPLVAWRETSEVLIGNGTLQGALEEGWTQIAVLWRDVPDRETAKRIVLVDNGASDHASYDYAALAQLLEDLPDFEGTSYTPSDVDRLLADQAASLAEPTAPAPAPEVEWITRPGDLITLGQHRLLCGDARHGRTWAKLLKGQDPPTLVWTDPPYGIDLVGLARTAAPGVKSGIREMADMEGDAEDDVALLDLIQTVMAQAHQHTAEGASYYLCHADTKRPVVIAALEAAGWSPRQILVWGKDHLVVGRQDYQWRHEPISYGWKDGHAHRWFGERDKTTLIEHPTRPALEALEHEDLVELVCALLEMTPDTVLRFGRPQIASEHPTSKPVEMILGHLHNSSGPGEAIADPFAGSGSTLLAAERAGRRAMAIETHPGFCDVIVTRWEELTGATAKRPRRRRSKEPA